jgi:hypothetical protein
LGSQCFLGNRSAKLYPGLRREVFEVLFCVEALYRARPSSGLSCLVVQQVSPRVHMGECSYSNSCRPRLVAAQGGDAWEGGECSGGTHGKVWDKGNRWFFQSVDRVICEGRMASYGEEPTA